MNRERAAMGGNRSGKTTAMAAAMTDEDRITTWGLILDSGYVHKLLGRRADATKQRDRMREVRRREIEAGGLVYPRRVIGLIRYTKPYRPPLAIPTSRKKRKS